MSYGIKTSDIKKAVENGLNGFTVDTINTDVNLKITPNKEYAILTIEVYLKNDKAIRNCIHVSDAPNENKCNKEKLTKIERARYWLWKAGMPWFNQKTRNKWKAKAEELLEGTGLKPDINELDNYLGKIYNSK